MKPLIRPFSRRSLGPPLGAIISLLMGAIPEPDFEFTGEYATDFEAWSEFYSSTEEINCLLEHGGIHGKNVLDVGCGSGRLAFRMVPPARSVKGIDIRQDLIDLCRKRLKSDHHDKIGRVSFEVGDAQDLGEPDDSYDCVLDSWTFSVLEDQESAAFEYQRVVKPGGSLLMIEERGGSPYQDLLESFAPDRYVYDPEIEIEKEILDLLGKPDMTVDVTSHYYFPTYDLAFSALVFNFEEWMKVDLDQKDKKTLGKKLRAFQTNGEIRIPEYSRFYRFDM